MNYDVIIIGAGPVGMYTAYYSGLRKMKTLICESGDVLGGQLTALYPDKQIFDIPGFSQIKASELIERLEVQLNSVSEFVSVRNNSEVTGLTKNQDGSFLIKTKNEEFLTKSIIIAAGAGSFTFRTLGLENEDLATNLQYKVDDLSSLKNKDVVIFGGGDSAVDWANMLVDIASNVTIVHRRQDFRAKQHSVSLLESSSASILKPYVADKLELNSDNEIVKITLKNVENDSLLDVSADQFLVNYGFVTSIGAISSFGVTLFEDKKIIVDQLGQTSVPGIYCCGDIAYYPGRCAQITTGFGEAINLTMAVKIFVDPSSKQLPVR